MLARHVPPLRRRDSARDLRPQLLHLALKVGDALLELALLLIQAPDLAAQPAELGAQLVPRARRHRFRDCPRFLS